MKYLVVSVILFFCTLQTFGQQDYFVYFQTDNNQAFYVRLNNTITSSTNAGYLILSRMPDSTHALTIGFPKNSFPEQQFTLPVNHKDGGYLLKNFGDKGWGLLNLQTMAVIMNSNPPEEKKSPEISGNRKNDAFSTLLANAVNDTAVLYTISRPKKPEPPPLQQLPEEKQAETVIAAAKDSTHNALVKKTADSLRQDSSATAIAKAKSAKDKPPAKPAIKPVADTSRPSLVKNNKPAGKTVVAPAKTTAQQKDSIAAANKLARNTAAKNNKQRKDTIIIMKGRPPEDTKPLAKKQVNKKDSAALVQANKSPTVTSAPAPLPRQVNKPSDTVASIAKEDSPVRDTVATVKNDGPPAPEKKDSVIAAAPVRRLRPLVNKAAELLTDTSYVAVFVDESKEKFDTIRISIPFNEYITRTLPQAKPAAIAKTDSIVPAKKVIDSLNELAQASATRDSLQALASAKQAEAAKTVQPPLTAKDSVKAIVDEVAKMPVTPPPAIPSKADTAMVPVNTRDTLSLSGTPASVNTVPKDTAAIAPQPVIDSSRIIKPSQAPLFMNSDCKEVAWDGDIDKLRIKMLLVDSDEEKIGLAKKVFKQKCLLARQVKALSELFKTDEGKYKWLDAAYPYVSDSGNFYKLGELIKDDYYFNRFKAMLRN